MLDYQHGCTKRMKETRLEQLLGALEQPLEVCNNTCTEQGKTWQSPCIGLIGCVRALRVRVRRAACA